MNILIVEDEFLTSKFIQETLYSLGFLSVFITDNAIDVNIMLQEKNIDLIFMDINIKGPKDGLYLAIEISKKYNTKIVFITSYQDTNTIQEASLSTPLGYLIKPIIKADIESIMMISKNFFNYYQKSTFINIDIYKYDKTNNLLYEDEKLITLSKLENKAIEIFIKYLNLPISNEILISYLWQEEKNNSSLRELISRLRKKVPNLKIINHSNIGYILKN
ncbi:response regulator [Aliarcobacter cryaerophilus]|uniref:response regulator n=1 Tax=Aliarcobacter cryaerophilus TaxID=28198 RepID=UPI0021B6A395|nr:response regulator [Aliarcobacter cryaerophilus]MCT7524392.1 response regulator [Aliarcobacter cryaerophilus]MCT7531274.1 response regulator [Aliarcobacter cryaerophilus]